MKIKSVFHIGLFCVFFHVCAFAQDAKRRYWGVEAGVTPLESQISNTDYIRSDIPTYGPGTSAKNLSSSMYRVYVGAKLEQFYWGNRLGVSTGLRFSRLSSTVNQNTYWSRGSGFFYWLYMQNGTTTEYIKVKSIDQTSSYLGIPLEARYFPFRSRRSVRFYFKLGVDINLLLQSNTHLQFYDNTMRPYESELTAMVEKPKPVTSSVYSGVGFRIVSKSLRSINFELSVPCLYIAPKTTGLLHSEFGSGPQIHIQFPIGFKTKEK